MSQQVMIIEDDLLLLMVEERLVNNLGFKVVAKASEGEQALRLYREIHPDILLVDINLRGSMSGLDIVDQLHKEGADIPIIFLSGEEDEALIQQAKETGCVDYLLKPITVAALKASLTKAMAYKKAEQFAA